MSEEAIVIHLGAAGSQTRAALEDFRAALRKWRLWLSLAWLDVKQRYRRAVIGPFWITISMLVLVLSLGVLYAGIFRLDVAEFLPYIAAGFVTWFFFSNSISDSTGVFVAAEGLIKYGGIPVSLHVLRLIFRNLIVGLHNISVMLLMYVWQPNLLSWNLLYLVPGLALMVANLLWVALVVGILCTRFRDLPPIIGNLLQVLFFVSPIVYQRAALPENLSFIAYLNPVFYFVEVVRAPLLGQAPIPAAFAVLAVCAVVGWAIAFRFFARTRARIAYWL